MDGRLFLATQLAKGKHIPENAVTVVINTEEISFYNENGKWINQCIWFENEQVGYDSYLIEFDRETNQFTVEDFKAWQEQNSNAVTEWVEDQQEAVKTLAGLVASVQADIERGINLAQKFGIPFEISLNGDTFDLRKIEAVDWNSSSMYC